MKIQSSNTPAGRLIILTHREIPITCEMIYTITGSGAIWGNFSTLEDARQAFSKYEAEGCLTTTGEIL